MQFDISLTNQQTDKKIILSLKCLVPKPTEQQNHEI